MELINYADMGWCWPGMAESAGVDLFYKSVEKGLYKYYQTVSDVNQWDCLVDHIGNSLSVGHLLGENEYHLCIL